MIKKKQLATIVSIAVASFLVGTMFNAITMAEDGGNPFEKIWEALYGVESDVDSLNASLIELEKRVRALEGPEPELVGYWNFDEGSGTTAHDSSGYGNEGTLVGSCSWIEGKYGKAIWFGGGGSYVVVPHTDDLTFTGVHPFTLEAWIQPDNPQGQSSLADNIIDKYSNYGLVYDHRNADARGVIFRSGGTWHHSGEVEISSGVWHHYVGVYDPPDLIAYLDGNEVARRTVGHLSLDENSNNVVFGTNMQLTSQYHGIIDEVKIYSGALSAEEIEALYQP